MEVINITKQKTGEVLPLPYQNMTPEQALNECFNLLLKNYGKIKHKFATSRQSTKGIMRGIAGLNEDQAKDALKDTLQTLLDMFDIAEMDLDHIHDAKLIYGIYHRQNTKEYPIKLVKESVEHYLAFYQGHMVPLRSEDTVSHLYESIFSKGLRTETK